MTVYISVWKHWKIIKERKEKNIVGNRGLVVGSTREREKENDKTEGVWKFYIMFSVWTFHGDSTFVAMEDNTRNMEYLVGFELLM